MLQQINHGISTGALFLIVGILYERRHTREISEYGGISTVMPVYATIALIMFMSSMGLPLLNGFVGEFTILQGTFMENKLWAAWAVPGVILAAAYLLWLYQRVFFGKVENPKNEKLLDLSARELATFIPLVLIALLDWPVSRSRSSRFSRSAGEQPGSDGTSGLSRTEAGGYRAGERPERTSSNAGGRVATGGDTCADFEADVSRATPGAPFWPSFGQGGTCRNCNHGERL